MKVATDIEPEYERTPTSPNHLRVYRAARNLTQEQLAEQAGISRITVGALERGENVPQLATARALAAALYCDPDKLFPPDENPK